MKVTAMKNDPGRTFQEMTDIRFLLTLPGIDRPKAESYLERAGLGSTASMRSSEPSDRL